MKRGGFTLVQVILVLAVLSTVTALAVPNYTSRLQESKVKADIVQMDTLLSDFQLNQIVPDYAYSMVSADNADQTAKEILQAYIAALFDSNSQTYMSELYSPDTEETLVLEGGNWVPVYRAESDDEYLWLSNRTTGTESDARVRIPDRRAIDDKYTEGENITWGDTLLLVGDRENMESRFFGLSCDNFVMESEFFYDNHVHQNQDHKTYYGLVFNYVDDDNFFMIALRLKNGAKKFEVYEVNDGNWTAIMKNKKLPNDFNPSGNDDFEENIDYETKVQVDNGTSGRSQVRFWIKKKTDPQYYEVFNTGFDVAETHKSQRYGFYIGDPLSGSKLTGGGEIQYITPEQDELYVFGDETTYTNPEVQIQLAAYPSTECVGEEIMPPPPQPEDWAVDLFVTKGNNGKWSVNFSMNRTGLYVVDGKEFAYTTPDVQVEIYNGKKEASIQLQVRNDEMEWKTNIPEPFVFTEGGFSY